MRSAFKLSASSIDEDHSDCLFNFEVTGGAGIPVGALLEGKVFLQVLQLDH